MICIEAARDAFASGEVCRAESVIDYVNYVQKVSNISLTIAIASIALAATAAFFAAVALMAIASTGIIVGLALFAVIRINRGSDIERAIEILKQMPNIEIQGGGTTLGLYLNAYRLNVNST